MAENDDPPPAETRLWRHLDARTSALQKVLLLVAILCAPILLSGWFFWSQTENEISSIRRQIGGVELIESAWPLLTKAALTPPDRAFNSAEITPEIRAFRATSIANCYPDLCESAERFYRAAAAPRKDGATFLFDGATLIADVAALKALKSNQNSATHWELSASAGRLPYLVAAINGAYMAAARVPPADRSAWRAFDALDVASLNLGDTLRRARLFDPNAGAAIGMAGDRLNQALGALRTKLEALAATPVAARSPALKTAAWAAAEDAVQASETLRMTLLTRAHAELTAREAQLRSAKRSAAALRLALLALAGVCAGALAHAISAPQKRLARAIRQIADGDLRSPIPYRGYRNETGDIARTIEIFRQMIVARKELETKMEMERRDLAARFAERTRDLETANAAKTDFVAQLSHEIRTPLNGVLGMAAALSRTSLNTEQHEMLRVITASGDGLLRLLNDSIDIARIEAGAFELEVAPFDLHDAVTMAALLYREAADAKSLSLHIALSSDTTGAYRGDATRLRQIVQNFVSNAVKFTERGEVTVSVRRLSEHDGRINILVAVEDSGPGLPKDTERLFKRYAQGAIGRGFDGAGLGLSICRELATLMGGSVRARPRVGGGAVFELELALEPVAHAPAPGRPRPLAGSRALVIEDNAVNRIVLRTLLEQEGVAVHAVSDGVEGVDAARIAAFDVILMDLHMPRRDGLAAARAIRALDGPNRATPILALTADASPAQLRACHEAAMDGHIPKPIIVDVLFSAVAAALAKSPRAALPRAGAA